MVSRLIIKLAQRDENNSVLPWVVSAVVGDLIVYLHTVSMIP